MAMRVETRFWQATVTGGLVTALLYFLLVYLRSSTPAYFWPALGSLLASWRGLEVLATFGGLSALALLLAKRLRHRRGWEPWQCGAISGAGAGLVYGLWLLAATGAVDLSAAMTGMIWFTVPFAMGGGITAAWYMQGG